MIEPFEYIRASDAAWGPDATWHERINEKLKELIDHANRQETKQQEQPLPPHEGTK